MLHSDLFTHQWAYVLFAGNTGEQATEAMHAIADAVTQCKFEATDPAADEVVLYKILQVVSTNSMLKACMMQAKSVTCCCCWSAFFCFCMGLRT